MTPDKTPSDAELDAILCNQWPAFSMQATLVKMWLRAAMRDGIAKWGSPVVAGEPVGEVESSLRCTGGFHVRLYRDAHMPEPGTKLYTTPQPTQSQAVPLDIEAAAMKLAECWDYPWEYMSHPGQAEMRKHAKAVIEAARARPGDKL